MLNRYPLWKNLLILVVIVVAFFYAAPNIFVPDPAVQIAGANGTINIDQTTVDQVQKSLNAAQIKYKQLQLDPNALLLRFNSIDTQLQAKETIQESLGNDYLVALNLAPSTPHWLKAIGATPMKLGLDLRGGVHFLIQVDVDSVTQQRIEADLNNISQQLRNERIRYTDMTREGPSTLNLQFRTSDDLEKAFSLLNQGNNFTWKKTGDLTLQGTLQPAVLQQERQETMEQTMNTLRNQVNELGVTEAIVQQQGATRVAVDLPGVQDMAQAKSILGKTATLEFHLVDVEHDANTAQSGLVPPGTKLYQWRDGPVLLKNQIILRGSSITSARSGFSEEGKSSVDVRLSGAGIGLFEKATADNVGKPMAVLYVEVKPNVQTVNGQKVVTYETEKKVISVANIMQRLGNSFQVTGLASQNEARNLALLLRAGALPAPTATIEEREIGPTLGKQNIRMGVMSVTVGFLLVVVFMALYYRVFGLIADLALAMNLILIVAVLSLLGATLTLPGIAGIVLTVGMAADANVLIFERIREELRNGVSVQASIHAGYERAFVTIMDANLTTLIVAIVLFGLGSSVVKAFAVTVTIGLITSMFTAITGTRAVVNWLYGGRSVKKISIGI